MALSVSVLTGFDCVLTFQYKKDTVFFISELNTMAPLGSQSTTFLSDESGLFVPFDRDMEQILGQIVSIRVKTLSHTNLVASWHIKREKSSLSFEVRRSKTSLLKFPILSSGMLS